MKKYSEGIDPNTGEYFYRERVKPKVQPQRLYLDMAKNIEEQLPSKIFPDVAQRLETFRKAFNTLREGGVLPDNHGRRLIKQIELKAERAMTVHRKAVIANSKA